jgi:hypothetical protein
MAKKLAPPVKSEVKKKAPAKEKAPAKSEAKKKVSVKEQGPVKSEVKKKAPAKEKAPLIKTQFELNAPEAREVFLGGDFNNWDTQVTPMKKDKNGAWKTTLSLQPGRYEYRFFVDNTWVSDLSCAGCVPNDFGTMNCIIIVK